jgi:hypothetical protein
MAKIILLLQFLGNPVWSPYIQSVCWCCRYVGPVRTEYILGRHNILIILDTDNKKTHVKF